MVHAAQRTRPGLYESQRAKSCTEARTLEIKTPPHSKKTLLCSGAVVFNTQWFLFLKCRLWIPARHYTRDFLLLWSSPRRVVVVKDLNCQKWRWHWEFVVYRIFVTLSIRIYWTIFRKHSLVFDVETSTFPNQHIPGHLLCAWIIQGVFPNHRTRVLYLHLGNCACISALTHDTSTNISLQSFWLWETFENRCATRILSAYATCLVFGPLIFESNFRFLSRYESGRKFVSVAYSAYSLQNYYNGDWLWAIIRSIEAAMQERVCLLGQSTGEAHDCDATKGLFEAITSS